MKFFAVLYFFSSINLRVRLREHQTVRVSTVGTRKIVEEATLCGRGREVNRWQGGKERGASELVALWSEIEMAIGPRHRGNCQELRGEIKAAPVFRRSIVGTRDTVPGTVLFIRNGRWNRGFRLIGFVSLCHRNRNATDVSPLFDQLLSLLRLCANIYAYYKISDHIAVISMNM